MLDFDVKPFATHLPILYSLLDSFEINSVLEFGCGLFSTELFNRRCKVVRSIEMGDSKWYNTMLEKLGKESSTKLDYIEDSYGYKALDTVKGVYDLIFVDGPVKSRTNCINAAITRSLTDLIIAHDTEDFFYRWDKVDLPSNWYEIKIPIYHIHTTVYTSRLDYKEWADSLDLEELRKTFFYITH